MRPRFTKGCLIALAILILGAFHRIHSAVIYDNSATDLNTRFNPGTLEVGDEILLASTERYLTNFQFEFWGTNTASPGNVSFAGSVEARVRFYLNNGAPFNGYSTPGTIIFDSGLFAVPTPTARSTFVFTAGSDFAPGGLFLGPEPGGTLLTNLTWSVQFTGMGATDSVGVDIYDPVVVGGNHTDYWEKDAGVWTLNTNSVPMNFAAKLEAAPEPSVAALAIVGGTAALLFGRRFGRKSYAVSVEPLTPALSPSDGARGRASFSVRASFSSSIKLGRILRRRRRTNMSRRVQFPLW